jgi:hypothetical protein
MQSVLMVDQMLPLHPSYTHAASQTALPDVTSFCHTFVQVVSTFTPQVSKAITLSTSPLSQALKSFCDKE